MARKSPADESEPCPLHREFMKDLSKEDVSWSWKFPVHGSQDASAVSEEKTSGLVFRKILPHQREVFASPENSLTSAVEEWDEEDWHTWVPSGKSLHPSQNPRDGFWTAKGGSPLERCLCSLRAGAVGGTSADADACEMPGRKKGSPGISRKVFPEASVPAASFLERLLSAYRYPNAVALLVGNRLCLAAEVIQMKPRRFLHLQDLPQDNLRLPGMCLQSKVRSSKEHWC